MNLNLFVKSLFFGSLIAFISSFYFQETTYLDSGNITTKTKWENARKKNSQFINKGNISYIKERREQEKQIQSEDHYYKPVLTKVWNDEYKLYKNKSKNRLEELSKNIKYDYLSIFFIFIIMTSGIYYLISVKKSKII